MGSLAARVRRRPGRAWYRIEQVAIAEVDERKRTELHRRLADVYAAAHGTDAARTHFLDHRKLEEFREVHLAWADDELIAWFGVNSMVVDGVAVETFDDAVVDPRYHRRGLTRALMLRVYRRLAWNGLRRRSVVAVLTTNPIVVVAIESHMHASAARYPGVLAPEARDRRLEPLACTVATRLHPAAPFDAATGVLSDFLPSWHLADQATADDRAQDYFAEHLRPGAALLMLIPIHPRMVVQHGGVWIMKVAQTWLERCGRPPTSR